jgi:hypothetical protein
MKRRLLSPVLVICTILISFSRSMAQSVGVGTATPDASAVLDVWGKKGGLLIPRLEVNERDQIGEGADDFSYRRQQLLLL